MLAWFFSATAWPMEAKLPYSPFHLILTAAGCALAVSCALWCARSPRIRPSRLLASCGLSLALLELYKQGFLWEIVFRHTYNWWYFPFQLCSVPMYLCLLYPFFPGRQKRFATFLQDFGLLGGIMTLAVPDGLLHPYWALTLHGFFWHFMLIFLGLYCRQKNLADPLANGFLRMLPLYFFCCALASVLNTIIQFLPGQHAYADLFYINCFFPSEQPVFRQISLMFGNLWGHLAYLFASCLGAWAIHRICGRTGTFCKSTLPARRHGD